MAAAGREVIIRELGHAAESISQIMDPGIIPAGGVSLAYALPGARSSEDVAVSKGRQVSLSEDLPAVRMVLTAMRFDPSIRCVGIIKYSCSAVAICEAMMLEICSYNRALEPPGITSIDWGVAFCCEQSEGVPDVIYDTGFKEKEPLIRILGENPTQVAASINRILSRIINTNLTEE